MDIATYPNQKFPEANWLELWANRGNLNSPMIVGGNMDLRNNLVG